ncbi:FtsB family cell division protein [Planococcus halotolerans]|uniref:Septum formation initiator family protein n=1 Tax=Planococcus halotolerans TaxID=2233542 RepID=A0A365KI64_9BACL|nr:septum formation initiator family protein [Planococcus halotolerans]QHJ69704.1 septum formation initiator family protein [Planococcus halotolerans]RAZ72799.1 septum formation initiator family protein [Planococcus halotolerans]
MSLKREKTTAAPDVASIRNDYVRSVERKEKRQMAHKVRLFRRLAVFGLVVLLATVWIGTTIYAQSQTMAEKEQLREEAQLALKEVKKEQAQLEEQIILLNDDEYLAKLAKKELFVSEQGEIIFTLPEK